MSSRERWPDVLGFGSVKTRQSMINDWVGSFPSITANRAGFRSRHQRLKCAKPLRNRVSGEQLPNFPFHLVELRRFHFRHRIKHCGLLDGEQRLGRMKLSTSRRPLLKSVAISVTEY